jgi:hypothetical protein
LLCAQRTGTSLATNAIFVPSGENCGEISAAGVFTRTVIFPLATSISEMSEVVQLSATGDFV